MSSKMMATFSLGFVVALGACSGGSDSAPAAPGASTATKTAAAPKPVASTVKKERNLDFASGCTEALCDGIYKVDEILCNDKLVVNAKSPFLAVNLDLKRKTIGFVTSISEVDASSIDASNKEGFHLWYEAVYSLTTTSERVTTKKFKEAISRYGRLGFYDRENPADEKATAEDKTFKMDRLYSVSKDGGVLQLYKQSGSKICKDQQIEKIILEKVAVEK